MMPMISRTFLWSLLALLLLLAGPLATLALGPVSLSRDWRTAGNGTTHQAPDPAVHREAVVQVYAGRAYGWRGAFAVHTWLAAKSANDDSYTRYEVIGWYLRSGGDTSISISNRRAPDGEWFGSTPQLVRDVRGADAEAVIAKLPQAVAAYPYAGRYSAWPGPNSNTFIAHLGREIPELRLTLPPIAMGKDYFPLGQFFARTPSGTGYQASLGGLIGIIAGGDEGFELNLLGLVTGVDLRAPALKLPGIGRVPG